MSKDYRKYLPGQAHHVYCKAVNGYVIFYSSRDCIYFLTLYYHLARRYGIVTKAVSIMPNHVHSNQQAPSEESFMNFNRDLTRDFAREYNKEHKRKGRLFLKPFGFAPKTVGKKIRDNISYIVNNPVAGKLSGTIDGYRWNLMAYRNSDHPFSEKIVLRKASMGLRRSLALLQYFFDNGIPLDYNRLRFLFKGLGSKETAQLTDRIISMHNFLDYDAVAEYYQGDIENAVVSISLNSGSEHDIPEDYEDYSKYKMMLQKTKASGIDLKQCNFETMPADHLARLAEIFSSAGIPIKQIRKFLHLKMEDRGGKWLEISENCTLTVAFSRPLKVPSR